MKQNWHRLIFLAALGCGWLEARCLAAPQGTATPDGWRPAAPREEIRPQFSYTDSTRTGNQSTLVIETDSREGLDGYWTKTFPVQGGQHYRFSALRKPLQIV